MCVRAHEMRHRDVRERETERQRDRERVRERETRGYLYESCHINELGGV